MACTSSPCEGKTVEIDLVGFYHDVEAETPSEALSKAKYYMGTEEYLSRSERYRGEYGFINQIYQIMESQSRRVVYDYFNGRLDRWDKTEV